MYDCIIIGAGAAGLYCSATFSHKINGLMLEKTNHPGAKLLMSGNGQCNITHNGSIKDFIPHYGKNGSKIRSCLYKYNNIVLIDFLKENGIPLFFRDDGKIFPKSMKAKDVLNMLLAKTEKNGFKIQYNQQVTGIEQDGSNWKVITNHKQYICKNLVFATGGFSYPSTGSDGSIFPVLKKSLGVKLTDFHPALTPVSVLNYPYTELSGISFKKVNLTLWRDRKKIKENNDDLLFTHKNFSGPVVLNMSKYMRKDDIIKFNYLYPLSQQDVVKKIIDATSGSHSDWKNVLPKSLKLPQNFIQEILDDVGNKPKAIATRITEDTFTITKVADFKTAMATSGGINLSEVNLKTMELKKFPHIYTIGEMLDIDGHTGGYNLQFAFSSAITACKEIEKNGSI